MKHPAGKALTSDWSTNYFIMVVYEKFQSEFSVQNITKTFSHRQPLNVYVPVKLQMNSITAGRV